MNKQLCHTVNRKVHLKAYFFDSPSKAQWHNSITQYNPLTGIDQYFYSRSIGTHYSISCDDYLISTSPYWAWALLTCLIVRACRINDAPSGTFGKLKLDQTLLDHGPKPQIPFVFLVPKIKCLHKYLKSTQMGSDACFMNFCKEKQNL